MRYRKLSRYIIDSIFLVTNVVLIYDGNWDALLWLWIGTIVTALYSVTKN